jgi:hypothetical protein
MSGRGSCSDVALRLVKRRGAFRALQLLRLQAARCRLAYAIAQVSDPEREKVKAENPNERVSKDCVKDSGYCVACCPWP